MSLMCHALPIQVSADSHINILWCPDTRKKQRRCLLVRVGLFLCQLKKELPIPVLQLCQTLVALCHHLPSFSRQRENNSNQRDRCSFLLLGGSGWQLFNCYDTSSLSCSDTALNNHSGAIKMFQLRNVRRTHQGLQYFMLNYILYIVLYFMLLCMCNWVTANTVDGRDSL